MESDQERFPATLGLGVLWILVFVAMCVAQGTMQAVPGQVLSGGISTVTSSRFGDITAQTFEAGEWWRALTCTFIHYSWLHLGFNLVMLYTLGRLMEPWYGWGGFLGIYCILGFFGSALAVTVKPYFGHQMVEHSGGGSGVLCGLIALLAVVGWRSKTRFGDYVKGQMVGLLAFIAVMGLVVPNVGNFEHAGGTVVGVVLGFLHRKLIRLTGTSPGRLTGVASLLLLATCAGLQGWVGQYPASRQQEAQETLSRLNARQEVLRNLQVLAALYLSRATVASEQTQAENLGRGSLIDPIQSRLALQQLRLLLQSRMNSQALGMVMQRQVQVLSASRSRWLPEEDQAEWEAVERQVQAASTHRPQPGQIRAFQEAAGKLLIDLTRAQKRDEQAMQELQARVKPAEPPRPQFGR